MRTISWLLPVALSLLTAVASPGALAQSASGSDSDAADAADAAPADDAEPGDAAAVESAPADAAPAEVEDEVEDEAADASTEPEAAGGDEVVEDDMDSAGDAPDDDGAAGEEPDAPATDAGATPVTQPTPSAADDEAAHAAAVEVETDNLRRALYAGIGMGALGALAGVVSIAATAGAVAMLTVPNLDPTIRTQGGPLLWFGISGILVGAVTTAAGGGLIGWSLLSDPEEAVDAVGNADPDAATTQQNNPPMAR